MVLFPLLLLVLLAAGTGLTMDDLHRAQALPVLADYACSSIAAWGKATKDGHLYRPATSTGNYTSQPRTTR